MSYKPTPRLLIRVAISTFVSLFVMGVALSFITSDLAIFILGASTFLLVWNYLKKRKTGRISTGNLTHTIINSTQKEKRSTEDKDRPFSFRFSHEEQALEAIESAVENHSNVLSVGSDTGYWYTNGETGPEWFAMIVACKVDDYEEIKDFIRQQLKERNFGSQHVNFVGSYH